MARLDSGQPRGMSEALRIIVRGRVQGVGFRPFIYQLATKNGLNGTVQNNMDGVRIIWEGQRSVILQAVSEINRMKPRLSRIDKVETTWIPARRFTDFSIIPSEASGQSSLVIPVDSATCADCLKEMRDPSNFRYHYPFINCTQCGPRYTIIDGLPYDRALTSMATFQMCDRCKAEYRDPSNRRHHAQPIACAQCGPHVTLFDSTGDRLASRDQAVEQAAEMLAFGKIIAVKGIGGFHLACDARSSESVERLRSRKGRPRKPLAVMCRNVAAAERIANVSEKEQGVLQGPEAPIVLLRKNASCDELLSAVVAPGVRTIGLMLPYTPLHHLLFDEGSYDYLVMTSANPSGLPMIFENEGILDALHGLADAVLLHNRRILHPVDDSVVQVSEQVPFFLRRSRGYVPDPVDAGHLVDGIVALGSQMKNTFAIGRERQAIIGPHLGDLEAEESLEHYQKTLDHLLHWTGIKVKAVARDMHPLYRTHDFAETFDVPVIEVQHHHAHHVACMADNQLHKPCFGIVLDGTGYGPDGTIWGFEVLHGDASGYQRLAHLRATPLPGGDRAVREPWRNAAAMLINLLGEEGSHLADVLFPEYQKEIRIIDRMIENKLNCPMAGTCGRLFDAVSAILAICRVSDYDGEAAIELSDAFDPDEQQSVSCYPFQLTEEAGLLQIDFSSMIRQIAYDQLNGTDRAQIARRFHETVVAACVQTICRLRQRQPALSQTVVLSGGSMSNGYLSRRLVQSLEKQGFSVYIHHRFPNGDGGLSLGQLMIAACQKRD